MNPLVNPLKVQAVLWVLAGAVFSASLIYLTPLKWVTIIEPSVREVEPREFQEAFATNPDQYIFIDIRSTDAYERSHAKGSLSLPSSLLADRRSTLPRTGQEVVLIGNVDGVSDVAYHYLEHFGHLNIARVQGGFESWILQGLPLEGSEVR